MASTQDQKIVDFKEALKKLQESVDTLKTLLNKNSTIQIIDKSTENAETSRKLYQVFVYNPEYPIGYTRCYKVIKVYKRESNRICKIMV